MTLSQTSSFSSLFHRRQQRSGLRGQCWHLLFLQSCHIWADPLGTQQSFQSHTITLLSFGILTWTPARNPVPRFEGQVKMYPRRSFHMNSQPRSWIKRSTYKWNKKWTNDRLLKCLFLQVIPNTRAHEWNHSGSEVLVLDSSSMEDKMILWNWMTMESI